MSDNDFQNITANAILHRTNIPYYVCACPLHIARVIKISYRYISCSTIKIEMETINSKYCWVAKLTKKENAQSRTWACLLCVWECAWVGCAALMLVAISQINVFCIETKPTAVQCAWSKKHEQPILTRIAYIKLIQTRRESERERDAVFHTVNQKMCVWSWEMQLRTW